MAGRTIRMMVSVAAGGRWLAVACVGILLALPQIANAQFGPLSINGFLEYQYRRSEGPGSMDGMSHLGIFRSNASTYLWRPWIMQVNASLGLSRTAADNADVKQDGTSITGALRVDLFRQSRFPFATYVDRRDSRVDSDVSNVDVLTTTYGFMQQYAGNRGGRYSLDYRRKTVDDIFEDVSRPSRQSVGNRWQANANKTLGRNQLVFKSVLTEISQQEPEQSQKTMHHTLQHRFRSGDGFFLEDTTFFSTERFEIGDFDRERRFLQFNGVSTWRPRTDKPLLIVGRGLLQGTTSGNDAFDQGSKSMALSASASYQFSDRVVAGANIGIAAADTDEGEDSSTVFQRVRADYRSTNIDLWNSQYRWSGSTELGNRTGGNEATAGNSVQDLNLTLNHSLSKRYELAAARELDLNVSQQFAATTDTAGRNRQFATHTVYATIGRQLGETRSYVRLSISDRRSYGEQRDVFQLFNVQASRSKQSGRHRSWSGSLTMQYGRISRQAPDSEGSGSNAISYSANLSYRHTDLFDVSNLQFTSDLRLLSSDFVTDEPLDDELDPDRSRTDGTWRNRLDYRIGLLQLRLEANLREIDGVLNSLFFLSVRRYYGNR